MGKTVILVLAILTGLHLSEAAKTLRFYPTAASPPIPKLEVFKRGIYPTTLVQVPDNSTTNPPAPLQIHSPNVTGNFPVLLFLHAACIQNSYYTFILQFIASHGYIIVAPQMFSCDVFVGPVSGPEEVEIAATVANWIPESLNFVMPGNAIGNLQQVAVGGHGRGGKTAFALALAQSKVTLSIQFSALIGLDPVAGSGKGNEEDPKILTYEPNSLDLGIPVTVIGTGLGNHTNWCLICPVCAPNDVNHVEFYRETKSPSSHIVTTDYGHVDFLDDELEGGIMAWITTIKCQNGEGSKDNLRRTIAGHMVAFLNAYYGENDGDYMTILHRPEVTPVPIDPPEFILDEEVDYAQI